MKSLVPFIVLVVACGGTDSTLGDGGPDTGTGSDATMQPDTGNPGPDASTKPDAAGDAANPPGDGGVTLNDAGNPVTIACGNSTCTSPDVCCVDTQNTTTFTCAASCQQNTTTLACVGNDCGSEVCCVFQQQGDTFSKCEVTCGQNEAQLCQVSDAGPTGCSSNQPCSSQNIGDWGLNPPFGTCGGVGN